MIILVGDTSDFGYLYLILLFYNIKSIVDPKKGLFLKKLNLLLI